MKLKGANKEQGDLLNNITDGLRKSMAGRSSTTFDSSTKNDKQVTEDWKQKSAGVELIEDQTPTFKDQKVVDDGSEEEAVQGANGDEFVDPDFPADKNSLIDSRDQMEAA